MSLTNGQKRSIMKIQGNLFRGVATVEQTAPSLAGQKVSLFFKGREERSKDGKYRF